MMPYPALFCLVAFAALLAGAALQDVRSRTISNLWPLALVLLFGLACFLGVTKDAPGSHALHFALALVAGFGLFAAGLFGGGDAKLYAAAALWFPLGDAFYLFLSVVIVGAVLAVVHLSVVMMRTRHDPERRKTLRQRELAYGVAIALGAMLALPHALA
jgi:prepilin peptidase CpaA